MVSIGKVHRGSAGERYYEREIYYAGPDAERSEEPPGHWVGAAAGELGLEGDVDVEALRAMWAGEHPAGGERLRAEPREGQVSAYDLTFSAPKSVGIVFAAASNVVREQIRRGHEHAFHQSLRYLEREACHVRRGHAGAERHPGEGFVAAAFEHHSSRAAEPQLHTHVVVANMARGPDGRFTALDGRDLFAHAKTAGYLYQAELRAELSDRLGVEWGAVRNGAADLLGVSGELIEAFSSRGAAIRDYLQERGLTGLTATKQAVLNTRPTKDPDVDPGRLREEWTAQIAERGLGAEELAALLGRAPTERPEVDPATLASELLGAAGLTRHASTFDRRDALQAAAERHAQGGRVAACEALADGVLCDPRAVEVVPDGRSRDTSIHVRDGRAIAPSAQVGRVVPAPGGGRYSTRALVEIERALIAGAAERIDAGVGVARRDAVERALATRPQISDEQRAMVEQIARSGRGVEVVRGPAGTGKTFALAASYEAWQRSGLPVYGAALSAQAAHELESGSGIPSTTIARLELDLERGGLERGAVLVVDEGGMVGTRDLARLASECERAEAKLVLCGDDRQLPEIEAGGAFRSLAERIGGVELAEVRRQREEWERDALAQLRDGDVDEYLEALGQQGRIRVGRDAQETRTALLMEWWQDIEEVGPEQCLIVTLRRSDAHDLNAAARTLMRAAGRLGEDELAVAGRQFGVGDRIVCLRNRPGLGLRNGTRGEVRAIADSGELVVRTDDGRDVTIDRDYLEAGRVDHGYASTVHKAQGMTVTRTCALGDDAIYREWAYTALSRHTEVARFYVTDPDALDLPGIEPEQRDSLQAVRRALERSAVKELALEEAERSEAIAARDSADLRQAAARLRPMVATFPESALLAHLTEEQLARARAGRAALEERLRGRVPTGLERDGLAEWRADEARLTRALADADGAAAAWWQEHGTQARELQAIESELALRAAPELEAAARCGPYEPAVQAELGPPPTDVRARLAYTRAAQTLAAVDERYGAEGLQPTGPTGRAALATLRNTRAELDAALGREPVEAPTRGRPAPVRDTGLEL